MMNVQKFIREKGWQELKDELAIIVKEYPEHGLFVLNYNQIESPKNHPVSNECRGLILDQDANVVCRPFSRFFNYGEADTKETFSFDDVTVYEKADGSLTKVYWCVKTQRWEIGTRGSAFAEVPHVFGSITDKTFREMMLGAMNFTEEQFQTCMGSGMLNSGNTYVMEYCSPYNRIVTPYEKPEMVLLAVISNEFGVEASQFKLKQWWQALTHFGMNVRLPKIYDLKSAEDCMKAITELPSLQEGYVIRNSVTGQRVKMKSPAYVAVHHLRGNGSPSFNNIAELILLGEHEEYLSYFDNERPLFDPIIQAKEELMEQMVLAYDEVKDIEVQKDFALKVKDLPFSGVLFKARKDKCSTQHAFSLSSMTQQIEQLRKFMEKKDDTDRQEIS